MEARIKSAKNLLTLGDRFFHANNMDSALVYYHQLANQYNFALSDKERQYYLDGVYGSFEVNMRKGDYVAAFEDLSLADEIIRSHNLSDYKLNMYYSAFYVVLASHTTKQKFYDRVLDYGRKACQGALKAHDTETAYRAFGNMITVCRYTKRLALMQPMKKEMERYAASSRDSYPRLALLMLKAADASEHRRYSEAVAVYDSMLKILPVTPATQRTRAVYLKNKGEYMIEAGDLKGAEATLNEAERLTYILNLRDVRLAILSLRQRAYKELKDSLALKIVDNHVLLLYDSLRSYVVADDLSQLEYMKERREMQNTVRDNAWRAKIWTWSFVAAAFVVLIVMFFLYGLWRKNKRLKEHSGLLYERIQRLLEDADAEKEKNLQEKATQPGTTVKYRSSGLDDEDKEEIAKAIKSVMETDAIYSADMSLTEFAKLVGRNHKAVSQVIHERYDCNFSSLINKARIMEFCRRMELPEYAGYSVEGIAESVGFASRNTFDSNFKRFTGLGLREYRKVAKQDKKRSSKGL